MKEVKNKVYLILFSGTLGVIIGLIVWGFLKITNLLTTLIWEDLASKVNLVAFPLIICTIGGIIIGIFQKRFGKKPELTQEVMDVIKKQNKYPYNNIVIMLVITILPLIFGGSLGPEAGLVGIVAGLCYYASDKLKNAIKNIELATQSGVGATLSVIFNAPMFGFVAPLEDNENIKVQKSFQMCLYIFTIIGALITFSLLGKIFGGEGGLPQFGEFELGNKELLLSPILLIVGIIVGSLNNKFEELTKKGLEILEKKPIIKATIAGSLLGGIGIIIPFTMFSGEHELTTLINEYATYSAIVLLIIGIVKLFITNFCIASGWRGGNIFPVIFSASSIGYGIAMILGINPVFACLVLLASSLTKIIKKPITVIMLLLICFNIKYLYLFAFFVIITYFLTKNKIKESTK